MPEQALREWFQERPKWLQAVARKIIDGKSVDLDEIADFTLKEAMGKFGGANFLLPLGLFGVGDKTTLRLGSIGAIEGINALAPKSPLDFGKHNLAVIYGLNGSGKSGYVRILKHACGARQPGELHPNVFDHQLTEQKSLITYDKDGESISYDWVVADGPIADLCGVDIFDTQCGRIYASGENEVSYEPPVLSFLSDLIAVSEDVGNRLDIRIAKLPSTKPKLPGNFSTTDSGRWFNSITAKTPDETITQHCEWTDGNETELGDLQKRLAEKSPKDQARTLRTQKKHLDSLIDTLEASNKALSDENCNIFFGLKKALDTTKAAATAAAEQVFQNAPLEGIGTDVWKQLWEKARQFSEQEAYKEIQFPNVGEDARCVLCQQPLGDEAKECLHSFEDFVRGALEAEAKEAETALQKAIGDLPAEQTDEKLREKLSAGGWNEDEITDSLIVIFEAFKARQSELLEAYSIDELSELPESVQWLEAARAKSAGYEKSALQYDEDAKGDNREQLEARSLELQANKWLNQQQKSIQAEKKRLIQLDFLEEAKRLTNTKALSRKKGELAELLITEAFVQRFNDELKRLRAGNINVELAKTKTTKGRVLHKLRLCGTRGCGLEDVLSEGEFRIIAIAAFLADVAGKAGVTPFVFDDPISSLDQDYEEAVVQRLVDLANDRQVIVFTHRLSLLSLIQDYGKKADNEPHLICVRQESWGVGEPGDTPLSVKKPEKALNYLLDHRLTFASNVLKKMGKENYEWIAKAMCSEFRILLERLIESDLMADVVQRYRRAVKTVGKLHRLSLITDNDCKLFDEMMTKYSKFEHSQPVEAPVQMPQPEEFKRDFETIKQWRAEFVKRGAQ